MIRRLVLALALVLAAAAPAAAHKLKVFATVEGDAVTGYAFFVGGGRARGTPWTAKTEDAALASGTTDDEGRFRFTPPQPVTTAITVTVDTREGHIASATLPASRFAGAVAVAPAAPPPPAPGAPPAAEETPAAPPPDTAALVEAAVQRQVEPLLERIEEMDSRLRSTDILSGIFLIVGLAGIGLWARGRKR
jgi:nickel transport protein